LPLASSTSSSLLASLDKLCMKHRSLLVVRGSEIVTCNIEAIYADFDSVDPAAHPPQQQQAQLYQLSSLPQIPTENLELSHKDWDLFMDLLFENAIVSLFFRWHLLTIVVDLFLFLFACMLSSFSLFFSWISTAFLAWVAFFFLSFCTPAPLLDFGTSCQLSVYAQTFNTLLGLFNLDRSLFPVIELILIGLFSLRKQT